MEALEEFGLLEINYLENKCMDINYLGNLRHFKIQSWRTT